MNTKPVKTSKIHSFTNTRAEDKRIVTKGFPLTEENLIFHDGSFSLYQ